MQILDLSHTISSSMPVYPGDQGVDIVTAGVIGKDGAPVRAIARVEK